MSYFKDEHWSPRELRAKHCGFRKAAEARPPRRGRGARKSAKAGARAGAALIIALASPALAADPTTSFTVSGQVIDPRSFDLPSLEALPASTQNVTYTSGGGGFTGTFTGVPLWTLLNDETGIKTNPAIKNDVIRNVVLVTGSDGYQVVYSAGELNPAFGGSVNVPLMAYASNGALLTTDGFARTTAPGDTRGGRYVSNVSSVQVLHVPYLTGTYAGGVSTSFTVSGLVNTPATYTLANITALPTTSVTVGANTYTGVTLWTLLDTAGVITNPQIHNNILRDYVVVTGSDGYQGVIALAEISPSFGNDQNIVAYSLNGGAAGLSLGSSGYFRLIVPGDVKQGRWISNIIDIEVFDAAIWMAGTGQLLDLTGLPITSEGLILTGGTLTSTGGPGTLTAATYLLQGGLLDSTANLGATGAVTQSTGVTLLKGQISTPDVTITGGTLQLGADNRLATAATLKMTGGSFDLAGYAQTLSTLNGTGAVKLSSDLSGGRLTVGSGTFGGVIADGGAQPGELVVAGPGVFTLSGANTFTGPTSVAGGIVNLDGGSLAGSIDVASGAALIGTGKTGSATIAGAVSPGDDGLGILTVGGTLKMKASAAYEVDLQSGGADRIAVSGTAALDGKIDVYATRADFGEIGQRYAIVTASGGRTGTFESVTWEGNPNLLFLDAALSYDATAAYVSLERNGVAFTSVAATPNAAATARALDTLGFGNGAWDALVELSSATDANTAFNALSGEAYAATRGVLIERSADVRDTLIERLRSQTGAPTGAGAALSTGGLVASYASTGKAPSAASAAITKALAPTPEPAYSLWSQGYGNFGRAWSDGNVATASQSTGGFLIGADAHLGSDWRVGVAGGYSATSITVDDRASSADSDNYTAALYAGGHLGAFALRFGGAYTWNDVSTSRGVSFPGFAEVLKSGSDLGTAQVFADLGYDIAVGAFAFEPYAAVAYVNLSGGDFHETWGAAALTGFSSDTDTTFTTLGLRASTEVAAGGATWRALVGLGWRHAFGDVDPTASLAFAAGSSPFLVEGAPIAENAAIVEAGLGVRFSPVASLNVTYVGQLANEAVNNSFKGTFAWLF